jgi:hypothetical protein
MDLDEFARKAIARAIGANLAGQQRRDADAAAMCRAFQAAHPDPPRARRRGGRSAEDERILQTAEAGKAALEDLHRERQARWEANAAKREAGWRAWRRAQEAYEAEYGSRRESLPVAASLAWMEEPRPITIW